MNLPENKRSIFRVNILFILVAAFMLLHVLTVFLGWYGNDDINYARWAARLINEGWPSTAEADHFFYRSVPVLTTALFYKLFGINDISSLLLSLVSSLVTLFLLRAVVIRTSTANWLALFLFGMQYTVLFYAHRLLPDSAMMMLLFAAYYVYAFYKGRMRALIFSLLLFLAFLTKENVLLTMPLWVFLMGGDLRAGREKRFWWMTLLAGVVLISVYLAGMHWVTGNFMGRWKALSAASYLNDCSYDLLPTVETIKRVIYGLWEAFLRNGDMLLLMPAIVSLFYSARIFTGRQERELARAFGVLLVSSNLMTISPTAYVLMCPDPRHFLFLMPFAALSGAGLIARFMVSPRQFPLLPLSMILLAAVAFWIDMGEMKYIYLSGAFVFAVAWAIRRSSFWLAPALVVVMLARPGFDWLRKPQPWYGPQKRLVQGLLQEKMRGKVLVTSALDAEIGEFWQGFRNEGLVFLPVMDQHAPLPGAFILLDTERDAELQQRLLEKGARLIRSEGRARLYALNWKQE